MKKASRKNLTKEFAEELDTFYEILVTLVELLEEKGVISQEEFENRLKKKLEKKVSIRSYRDIQFGKKKQVTKPN